MAMTDPGWWKATFNRKKNLNAKVLYEIPAQFCSNTDKKEAPGSQTNPTDSRRGVKLEKTGDKTTTKGRQVKVSHSGRFKEKKRIRASLSENSTLFPDQGVADENLVADE
ncbi:proline-rich protein 15-like protein B [Chanos chanos]|uniref:Proline-rich protein 15-like protein B n=1 Tax=Chanos chanos TaxID=29144 RepID=A0A6J2VD68_CHACN|nr:proline-rich protein 15-like protein B [Chanos chanos]